MSSNLTAPTIFINIIEILTKFYPQAVREYAEAHRLLAGHSLILETCREWLKRNAVNLPPNMLGFEVNSYRGREPRWPMETCFLGMVNAVFFKFVNQDSLTFFGWVWTHEPVIIILIVGFIILFFLIVVDAHRYRKKNRRRDNGDH